MTAPIPPADVVVLRRLTLAVSVLDEIDLQPHSHGVRLLPPPGSAGGSTAVLDLGWDVIAGCLNGAPADTETARRRVCRLFRVRLVLATADAAARVRPLGLPRSSTLHPGDSWTHDAVLGGALSWGAGVALPSACKAGLPLDMGSDETVVPVSALDLLAAGVRVDWNVLAALIERMGSLAADRLSREPAVLKPMGACDVVTLLASRSLRTALAGRDRTGMCAAVIPMRRRGWLDPSRTDPAFALAAAAATDEDERGFDRPVFITADEVALAVAGARPAEIVLRDPVVSTGDRREVRWQGTL